MGGAILTSSFSQGGCSQHHALVTVYPHRSDWDGVAQLTGDASWNADNMRKYFEKIERLHYSPTKMSGHGTNGWLSTTLPSSKLVASDSQILGLIRSALNLFGGKVKGPIKSSIGLETAIDRDINSNSRSRDTKEGVFQHPNSVTSGRRHGPREFVLSVAGVKNKNGTRRYHLDIQLNTLVTKVRFQHDEDGTHRAVGVDYLVGRSLYKADPRASEKQTGRPGHAIARKEVILSAGTFNTPQLLKLSGIGPRQELEAHGINTVVDLPGVGTNLQDRYEVTVIGETPSNLTFWDTCKLGSPDDPCVQRWKAAVAANDPTVELNPLAQSSFVMTMIKKSSQALTDPDLIIGGATLPFRGYYPDFPRDSCHRRQFTMVILKGHTNNRAGTVTLRSNNPRDVPKIEFRYFDEGTTYDESGASADMRDLDAVVEGVRFAREVFAGVEGTEFKEVWPGENITTTEDLRKFVRDEAWGHHASCSCPIGPDTDPMAVLDSKFRVRGVKGLRVVDASVFPKIPGFFIIVPIYMISEKAADVILGGV